jgi:cell filamentation protein
VPDDPYTEQVTGVLRNKLRLDTAEELAAAEREITHAALILIRESPGRATYDLPQLRTIHQRIFSDIYEWPGQVRTVAISKGSLFCLPQYIESSSADIFRALRRRGADAKDARHARDRRNLAAQPQRAVLQVRPSGSQRGSSG